MRFSHYQYSSSGPRKENQDSLVITELGNEYGACIADGVGGQKCGDLASKVVLTTTT